MGNRRSYRSLPRPTVCRICHDPGVTDAHEGTLGPLVDTTVRVATWNLWWRFGPWEQRAEPILATLRAVDADVIALQEVWAEGDRNQAADLAEALGGYHHTYAAKYEFEGVWFGNAVLSRWPIADEGRQDLPTPPDEDEGRLVVRADIDGPRGRFSVYATHLHYRLHHGPIRQDQVKAVCAYIRDTAVAGYPAVLCGDFNAAPDSDEIRMLTGKAAVPAPPLVFRDVWELVPGEGPGLTWSNDNPYAALEAETPARIDYVFVSWPEPGGRGHATSIALLGDEPVGGIFPSDHFGLVAELRY
jgi:endonuclease/exonuclease/phosphatase family metal-dependent hydrolase